MATMWIAPKAMLDREYLEYGMVHYFPAGAPRYRKDSDEPVPDEEEEQPIIEKEASVVDNRTPEEIEEERQRIEEQRKAEEDAARQIEEMKKKRGDFEAIAGGKQCSAEKAAEFVRANGFGAPSQEEIRALDEKYGNKVDYDIVQAWMKEIPHADTASELATLFAYFDKEHKGTLTKRQVKNLLCTYGEPLSDEEIETILAEFGMTGDVINYQEFCNLLLGK